MRSIAKSLMSFVVDVWARFADFSFPQKYGWKWKLAMLTGRYEPPTTRLVRHLVAPGMTVVDVGAHVGYFTRLSARLAGASGRVFAFEPDQENRVLLERNTARYSNVTVRPEAISDHSGTVMFYHVRNSTGCHSTIPPLRGGQAIEVAAVSLDDLCRMGQIGSIDVVKMDIEGGEPAALRGMREVLARGVKLIVEYNADALTAGGGGSSIFEPLTQNGYSISAITDSGLVRLSPPYAAAIRPHLSVADQSVNLYCEKL